MVSHVLFVYVRSIQKLIRLQIPINHSVLYNWPSPFSSLDSKSNWRPRQMPKNGRSFSIYEHSASSILQKTWYCLKLDTKMNNKIKHSTQAKIQSANSQRSKLKIASKKKLWMYPWQCLGETLEFELINSEELKRQWDIMLFERHLRYTKWVQFIHYTKCIHYTTSQQPPILSNLIIPKISIPHLT